LLIADLFISLQKKILGLGTTKHEFLAMKWFRERKGLVSSLSTFSSPECLMSAHVPTETVLYREILFIVTRHMIRNGLSV